MNERGSRSLAPYRRSLIPLPESASVVDARIGDHGPALLTLEDGSVFPGVSWGAPIASGGDLVMNTSQSGYQEICTDPSYAGQVVLMTYPLIGNYGRLSADDQSSRPWLRGLVVAHATAAISDDAAQLAALLRSNGVPAIAGVETRSPQGLQQWRARCGVIIASGGFSADVAMRSAFRPILTTTYNTTNHRGATGEMIRLAQAVGADAYNYGAKTVGSMLIDRMKVAGA